MVVFTMNDADYHPAYDNRSVAERNGQPKPAAVPVTLPSRPSNPQFMPMANPYAMGGDLYGATQQPAFTPGTNPNVFDTASEAYTGGVQGLAFGASPVAPMLSMNMFMNPYRNMVLDNALGRLRDEQAQGLNMVRGQAHQASAYGGARHGLVEAELMDRYNRNAGELATSILSQGFDTTAGLGLTSVGQQIGANQARVGAAPVGFSLGESALQGQLQSGNMQQMMLQRILDTAGGNADAFRAGPQEQLRTAVMGTHNNPLAMRSQTTQQYNPGMFDYLSMGMGILGGGK